MLEIIIYKPLYMLYGEYSTYKFPLTANTRPKPRHIPRYTIYNVIIYLLINILGSSIPRLLTARVLYIYIVYIRSAENVHIAMF